MQVIKANKWVTVRAGLTVYLHIVYLYYTNPVVWNFLCHVAIEDSHIAYRRNIIHPPSSVIIYAVGLAIPSKWHDMWEEMWDVM